jgi:predicted small integral membrane protein
MLEWMAWSPPVAVFFICVALMLACMTYLEIRFPTVARKGFLPMVTTRGDRLFIGLLGAAYIHLVFLGLAGVLAQWLSLNEDPSIWWGTAMSLVWLIVVLRKG